MPANGPLLKLINVTRRYDVPDSAGSLTVLNQISLEVAEAESLAIIGPSGSGKSTLLHLIGTLDRPTSGEVLLEGKDLATLDEAALATVRNRQIGFVFQTHYLLPQCTVLENVLVPTLAAHSRTRTSTKVPSPKSQVQSPKSTVHGPESTVQSAESTVHESPSARAHRLLARVGLSDRLAHRPGQLSGGERQRVAVVRALINLPRLLLADEPTGSLDQESADRLAQLLAELNREERVTLILVTHSTALAKRMRRALELKNGRLVPAAFGGTSTAALQP